MPERRFDSNRSKLLVEDGARYSLYHEVNFTKNSATLSVYRSKFPRVRILSIGLDFESNTLGYTGATWGAVKIPMAKELADMLKPNSPPSEIRKAALQAIKQVRDELDRREKATGPVTERVGVAGGNGGWFVDVERSWRHDIKKLNSIILYFDDVIRLRE